MDTVLLRMLLSQEDEHIEEDADFRWESVKSNPKYGPFLPKNVHALVAPDFQQAHLKLVNAACKTDKVFPSSLMHPLRSVMVMKPGGGSFLANISIGVLTQVCLPEHIRWVHSCGGGIRVVEERDARDLSHRRHPWIDA